LPVVADTIGGYAGPLAGILAGIHWDPVQRPGCAVRADRRGGYAILPPRPFRGA
jgi:molybdopterin-guanine dinucleotide biosynthesis protein A